MYDSVRMVCVIGREDRGRLVNCLENVQVIDYREYNLCTYRGMVGCLRVRVNTAQVIIEGSLPKYRYGSNVQTLSRHSTEDVVGELSDRLGLDLGLSWVTYVEFGTNFPMDKGIGEYIDRLGDLRGFNRVQWDYGGVYYRRKCGKGQKELVFYDKVRECREHNIPIPPLLSDKNLLRYELRLRGKLATQLGVPEVRGATLWDMGFYRCLTRMWQGFYFDIEKRCFNELTDDFMRENIGTPKEAKDVLFGLLMNNNPDVVRWFNGRLKAGKVLSSKNFSMLKKSLDEIRSKGSMAVSDEDIRELDNAVDNAGEYV